MRNFSKITKRHIIILTVLLVSAVVIGATGNEYFMRTQVLSDEILTAAGQLQTASHDRFVNAARIDGILAEMKGLIEEYEENLVFAQSRYPGEILLGKTAAGHNSWLEAVCDERYGGVLKEIRIRRLGRWPQYIRINDIEITYQTPRGVVQETLNENGRVKLYRGSMFAIALPRPMRIQRIRINVGHASSGLEVYGVPSERLHRHVHPGTGHPVRPVPPVRPRPVPPVQPEPCPEVMLLGTTPPGHNSWTETLCRSHCGGFVREIRLKRTGRASYLRINDIELTYLTPNGPKTELLNEGGRVKLYYSGEFKLALPRPMRVVRIRINIGHESTGLEVYGIH